MSDRREMDQLFHELLPSATAEQIESARPQILNRLRADAADIASQHENAEVVPLNYGDYYILAVLSEGERHGYAIMSEVEAITDSATKFGPGTLYTSIDRLLTAGLIEESRTRPDPKLNDEPRRHFLLTGQGQKVLASVSERLAAQRQFASVRQIARTI